MTNEGTHKAKGTGKGDRLLFGNKKLPVPFACGNVPFACGNVPFACGNVPMFLGELW